MRGSAVFRTGIAPGGALAGPWVQNPLWTAARAVPSLDLRFADNKSLVDAVTGASLVTFTRASSGTFVGSNGVLQNAVTNLLLRSEEFTDASWQLFGTTSRTANTTVAPNGTITADSVTLPASSGIFQIVNGLANTAYTFSIWIRCDTTQSVRLVINTNLSDPTTLTVTATSTWQRFNITKTTSVGTTTVTSQVDTGGGNTFFLWGAQLEQSTTVGEYVPTTSAINSAPRFDHNPTTGESLGLLVEEARTNLMLRSEAIATSPWFGGANTTLTNNTGEVLDPAGGSTATKVVVSGGTGAFGQSATLTAVVHSGSIWLRCATGTISASLIVYLAGSPFTNIGTTNVTITTSWQRFSVVTSTATAAAYNLQLNTIAVGTVYAWGAQLEAGAFPTSYIPTTTAAATRSADVASITGSNFSSWYNQTEGTVFADANVGSGTFPYAYGISDGTGNNRIILYRVNSPATTSTPFDLRVDSGGSNSASFSLSAATTRFGFAYKANDFAISGNGGAPSTDTSGAVPSVNQMTIGGPTFFQCNGTIKRFAYFPTRLANSTLQALTQ